MPPTSNTTLTSQTRPFWGKVLRLPTGTRPGLYLIETPHGGVVVKDYGTKGLFFRNTVGRVLVLREKYAYQRLGITAGVPIFYGATDPFSLCLEFVSGVSLEELEKNGGPPQGLFSSLEKLVEEIHGKGIVHCDIKRAANVLVSKEGRVWLIDWAASLSARECRIFPLKHLYRRLLLDDNKALTKFRLRFVPHTVSLKEMENYLNRSNAELLVRAARDLFRTILKKGC